MKKPRPFSLRPIYVDERRERLAAMERQARRELGLEPSPTTRYEDLRGLFSRGQRHVQRRRNGLGMLSTQKLVFIIMVLLMIWKLLS